MKTKNLSSKLQILIVSILIGFVWFSNLSEENNVFSSNNPKIESLYSIDYSETCSTNHTMIDANSIAYFESQNSPIQCGYSFGRFIAIFIILSAIQFVWRSIFGSDEEGS